MIYVMSDLHGRYDLYRAMLDKIELKDTDTLYILGDFVDRGGEGLKILLDIQERRNVIGLMGNHDYHAHVILSALTRPLRPGELEDMRSLLNVWTINGGKSTYREFKSLTPEERYIALTAIDNLRIFAEVKAGGREFVLCHGGISDYTPDRPLSDYPIESFIFVREDYSIPKFNKEGKYLITGHTPTVCIEGATEGRIYRSHDHIAIDCGAVFGCGLGCLCLDTLEEFYVS